MPQELPFEPFPFLSHPNRQTILGSMLSWSGEPPSSRKIVPLGDGDKLSLEITTPRGWRPSDPTVILVHGLCGSHRSSNIVRMVKKLKPLGIRVVRYNMRGCGSGRGLAKQIYHSGRSEDVFAAILSVREEYPMSPITLVGFSLGGNIVLKLAGELHTLGDEFLKSVIAISPPVDLYASVLMLGDAANAIYEKYFYRLLRNNVYYIHRLFKDLPKVFLPRDLKLYEFDQVYTVPRCGFPSAEIYYERCSALQLIDQIALPCKILLAEDDPIVSASSFDEITLPSNVKLFKTKKGGHMGYLSHPQAGKGLYWLDALLVDWILGK